MDEVEGRRRDGEVRVKTDMRRRVQFLGTAGVSLCYCNEMYAGSKGRGGGGVFIYAKETMNRQTSGVQGKGTY